MKVILLAVFAVAVARTHAFNSLPDNVDSTARVASCSDVTSDLSVSFINEQWPNNDYDVGSCSLTILHTQSICQLRLDFEDFELSEPSSQGLCDSDFFRVDGYHVNVPTICGKNDLQHMYVELDATSFSVNLNVERMVAAQRLWRIHVTQIGCDSPDRAPSGCLQYHTGLSGTVNSFNFAQTPPLDKGTREIQGLSYGVCIMMNAGYCGIKWTRRTTDAGDYGFTLSGDIDILAPGILGTPMACSRDNDCFSDYVIIPDGVDDTNVVAQRYCGLGFPNSVTSTATPFVLYVKTNENELGDTSNHGFSLEYTQLSVCP